MVRQVDAGEMLRLVQRGATGLFAAEMGADPLRVIEMDWRHFSAKNSFHALASDARALGTYLVSTGLDVPVSDLAAALGLQKQIVSRLIHRGEDLRDNAVAVRIISKIERIYGVGE